MNLTHNLLITLIVCIIFEDYKSNDPGNTEMRYIKDKIDLKVSKLISIKLGILNVKKS